MKVWANVLYSFYGEVCKIFAETKERSKCQCFTAFLCQVKSCAFSHKQNIFLCDFVLLRKRYNFTWKKTDFADEKMIQFKARIGSFWRDDGFQKRQTWWCLMPWCQVFYRNSKCPRLHVRSAGSPFTRELELNRSSISHCLHRSLGELPRLRPYIYSPVCNSLSQE